MIFTIAYRELRNLFLSPLAWVILGVIQAVFGITFYPDVVSFMRQPHPAGLTAAVVSPLFGWVAILLLFVIPLLTMRLVSEERRNATLCLLLSAPLSMTEIVLGKFLGIVLYLLTMIFMLTLMPVSLLLGGTLDFGLLFMSALGLILLLASFAAIGLFMSTLTQSPTLAAISTFGALFVLWILQLASELMDNGMLAYLSIVSHYLSFLEGVFNTADVFYYILLIGLFLVLSVRRLEGDRLGG
jgi:ABC-2 type transport system permease protein